jgi:hypothetical protein
MSEEKDSHLLFNIQELANTYGKWTKQTSNYIDKSTESFTCSNCFFYQPDSCSVVEGDINPLGHCKLWIMKANTEPPIEDMELTENLSQSTQVVEAPLEIPIENPSEIIEVTEVTEVISEPIDLPITTPVPSPTSMYPLETMFLSTGMAKVPLAKKGKWKHDKYGIVQFTDNDFQQAIDNLSTNSLGHTPYLTFGHLDEELNSTDSHRKRGDLERIEVEGDVLYGLFNAKPEAQEAISKGEYQFSSGEFIRNFTDKESGSNKGTVFLRVALTNSPFIPFSQEEKVQILSSTSTLDILPFVVNLSTVHSVNPQEELSMTTQVDQSPKEELEAPQESITPTPVPSQSIDIAALISQITESVKGPYEAQLSQALSTIEELKGTVQSVSEDLKSQKEVTHAYSLSMNKAQEANLNQSLLSAGVSAALVQNFSDIRTAIANKQDTIKLSQGEGKEDLDLPLIQALSQLLVSAVKSEPVPYEQVGAPQPKKDQSGVISEIESIIAANKQRIKK